MEYHPVANLFPMMSVEELKSLKKSMQARGQLMPIYTHEGKIIDGRNRYQACIELGIKPRFEAWNGVGLLVDFVWDLNAMRRQLKDGPLHMAAGKYAIEREKEAKQRSLSNLRQGDSPITPSGVVGEFNSRRKAAEKFGVGTTTVDRAVRVIKHGAPELIHAVESKQVSVSAADEISRLPIEKQKEVITRGKNEILKMAKDIERERVQKRASSPNGAIKPISQKPEAKEDNKEIKLQGVGVTYAHEAINCLKRIPKNDGLRKNGFQIVMDWIRREQ